MSKKQRNRMPHYRKSSNNTRPTSLRSLVTEITGLDEHDKGFEAARKDIERMDKFFRIKVADASGSKPTGTVDRRTYAALMKSFYHGGVGRELFEKFRSGEPLNVDELDAMIDIIKQPLLREADDEETAAILSYIDTERSDKFYDLAQSVSKKVKDDIALVDLVQNAHEKIRYIERYHTLINDILRLWREEVLRHVVIQDALERAFQKNPSAFDKARSGKPLSTSEMSLVIKEMLLTTPDK